ncbi:GntR family transcriptional regulator [Bacillus sp. B1-b2]|uniref:GntR family transcriptional regulator n=1 Tax=Bacillus sp. B1-b2 TaxID=2653201 RepID=UPI001261EC23|nr:GntR family transcriptional regulator [Bacillus sp. B1-b2]KAB7667696.1 GntR family transcriptional regulator [Bacillus sp. B1-b2]
MTQSLKQKVYTLLKSKILNNELSEGEYLEETKLAELFGVSRTPVREAINALETENLVQIIPKKGTFVTTLTTQNIKELFQSRHIVEPVAFELAFPHLDSETLLKFKNESIINIENKDYKKLHQLDYEFHNYINSMCRNKYIIKFLNSLSDDFQRVRTQDFFTERRTLGGAEEHLLLIDQIIEGDLNNAIIQLKEHISNTEKYYFQS